MEFEYKLIRSKRRTLCIEILNDFTLLVRAPLRLDTKRIEQFIIQKKHILLDRIKKLQNSPRRSVAKQYIDGEEFLYLGNKYPLKMSHDSVIPLSLSDSFYLSPKVGHKAKSVFKAWYKRNAFSFFHERSLSHCRMMGLRFERLRVNDAGTRWGSCSNKGNLNLNMRLLMAPIEIIDYVIIHELAHLKHKNHSKHFWDHVGQFCPDYKAKRKWLRVNGGELVY